MDCLLSLKNFKRCTLTMFFIKCLILVWWSYHRNHHHPLCMLRSFMLQAGVKDYVKLSVFESRGSPFFQLANLNPGHDVELVCRGLESHLVEHLPCTWLCIFIRCSTDGRLCGVRRGDMTDDECVGTPYYATLWPPSSHHRCCSDASTPERFYGILYWTSDTKAGRV